MTTRIRRDEPRKPFGLEGWLESTRISLPLRSVSVNADVTAGFANVEIDQIFQQTNAQALDCRYVFPLPADAAVYRCEMHVNGRLILAKIEERSAAEKIFQDAKKAGHRAALAVSERDNLFTLQLGNVQPGDCVLMRFAYLQTVRRMRGNRNLRVPVNPGVRYIAGEPLARGNSGSGVVDDTNLVPDASRITPPRIDTSHADAASLHALVRLRGAGDCHDSASSPSHPLVVKHDGEDLIAQLAANGHLPDRDLVISWRESKPLVPIARAWLDRERRGVLELRLPEKSPDKSLPADIYILLDCSGSMDGENWSGACEAVASFMPQLHPDTRIWITLFESTVHDYDTELLAAGEIDLGPAGEKLRRFGTRGGTELEPAVDHIRKKLHAMSPGHDAMVLLITDGQIGNERGVTNAAQRLGCPVHVIGVAMTMNDGLDVLAEVTGGRSVFLSPGDDIAGAIENFVPMISAPAVTGLAMPEGWTTADGRSLPKLANGDDLIVPISASSEAAPFALTGVFADGSPWDVACSQELQPGAALVWARARIRHLDRKRQASEALVLAKEFNILSKNAAFVAWDKAEKVPVAQGPELFQPSMEPVRRFMACPSLPPSMNEDRECDEGLAEYTARPRKSYGANSLFARISEMLPGEPAPQPVPTETSVRSKIEVLLVTIEIFRFTESRLVGQVIERLLAELHEAIKGDPDKVRWEHVAKILDQIVEFADQQEKATGRKLEALMEMREAAKEVRAALLGKLAAVI